MNLPENYISILKSELSLRFRKNPRYSLRAFARDLDISAARLSEILNGRKGLSRSAAQKIAEKIGLKDADVDFFCDLVDSLHGRSALVKKEATRRISEVKNSRNQKSIQLNLDSFRLVEDWYHYAILELLKIDNENCQSSSYLAKALGISLREAEEALGRLLNLDLIENKTGRYLPVYDWVMSSDPVPSQSIKKHHELVLKRAIETLYMRPIDERSFRTSIFTSEIQKIPEIGEEIRKFSIKIMKKYSSTAPHCEVMAFSLQAFPLSNCIQLAKKG